MILRCVFYSRDKSLIGVAYSSFLLYLHVLIFPSSAMAAVRALRLVWLMFSDFSGEHAVLEGYAYICWIRFHTGCQSQPKFVHFE